MGQGGSIAFWLGVVFAALAVLSFALWKITDHFWPAGDRGRPSKHPIHDPLERAHLVELADRCPSAELERFRRGGVI